jgi:hypothetical protein
MLAPRMLRETGGRIARRIHSDLRAFGFRRDLQRRFTPPQARIALTVRPMEPGDLYDLLRLDDPAITAEESWERASRRRLVDSGIGRCFVAATADGRPCYMQWLFGAADNDRLAAYFDDAFPRLGADEALLEGAFTPSTFRGRGVMPAAMARIAERGTELGARAVITFVGDDNMASMKGCVRAGFLPYMTRRQCWRALRRRTSFGPLPDDFATAYAPIFG